MPDTEITMIGNLVENPVLRITASGVSVCGFRVASTPRRYDRAEQRFVDGNTLYLRVSCWRQLAENVAASLSRGDRVLVVGRLRQNNYETQDGDRRVSYEVDAEAVAAELTWRPVEVRRVARSSAGPADSLAASSGYPDPLADPGAAQGDPFGHDDAAFDAEEAGDPGAVDAVQAGEAGGAPGSGGMAGGGAAQTISAALADPPGQPAGHGFAAEQGQAGQVHLEQVIGADQAVRGGTGPESTDGTAPPTAQGERVVSSPQPPIEGRLTAGHRGSSRRSSAPSRGVTGRLGAAGFGLADVVGEHRLLGQGGAAGG
ncbi:single-stranded DNA-binding protein [Parafrankia sp. EUN1f]|uniref:single-stranded DNA-binding protein n=1 Tax=Parafrankia sp. EUN1f TaxID=102897 RepID=UPI0001C451E4|nr:single-stranded DNA-binding protein [Parafrankia sp. EUN1f]EFC83305.1 single-strand binding protein [Parafrankia sp. EUN1f]